MPNAQEVLDWIKWDKERNLTKKDYVEMLEDRAEYLKQDIADYKNCNGSAEWDRLTEIKVQASRIIGVVDAAKEKLFGE